MKKIILLSGLLILLNIDIVNAAEYIKCGSIDTIPAGLPAFSRNVINLIKVFVPVLLCIMGMLDFAKAAMAGDEKSMKDGPKKFIKRVISAVLVYFVVAIVQFIIDILGASGSDINEDNNFNNCLKCFVTDEEACQEGKATIIEPK